MERIIKEAFIDSAKLKKEFSDKYAETIKNVADLIAEAFKGGYIG